MDQGTLSIIQTKSGKLIARVTFTKSDGKTTGVIDVQIWSPTKDDMKYNDTPCEFQREKGMLLKIKTNEGRVIEKSVSPPQAATAERPNTGSRNTSGSVGS